MEIRKIQTLVFEEYKKNGYLENWNKNGKMGDIAEISLIVTEVAELLEVIRNKETLFQYKFKLSNECADIIIRTLNFMARKGLDVETAITTKHYENCKRAYLHGKEI